MLYLRLQDAKELWVDCAGFCELGRWLSSFQRQNPFYLLVFASRACILLLVFLGMRRYHQTVVSVSLTCWVYQFMFPHLIYVTSLEGILIKLYCQFTCWSSLCIHRWQGNVWNSHGHSRGNVMDM